MFGKKEKKQKKPIDLSTASSPATASFIDQDDESSSAASAASSQTGSTPSSLRLNSSGPRTSVSASAASPSSGGILSKIFHRSKSPKRSGSDPTSRFTDDSVRRKSLSNSEKNASDSEATPQRGRNTLSSPDARRRMRTESGDGKLNRASSLPHSSPRDADVDKGHSEQHWLPKAERRRVLSQLLLDPQFRLAGVLEYVAPLSDLDQLALCLVEFYAENNMCMDLVRVSLAKEIDEAENISSLLRGSGMAPRLMTKFCRLAGVVPYIQEILTDPIEAVLDFDRVLELNPIKLEAKDIPANNARDLLSISKVFLEAILSNEKKIPGGVKLICNLLMKEVAKKWPGDGALQSVGAFFFLRLICVAISAPEAMSIMSREEVDITGQKNLILVSKVVQQLGNRQHFREDYMIPLNPFIDDSRERFTAFLEKLADISQVKFEAPPHPAALTGLWLIMQRNQPRVVEKLYAEKSNLPISMVINVQPKTWFKEILNSELVLHHFIRELPMERTRDSERLMHFYALGPVAIALAHAAIPEGFATANAILQSLVVNAYALRRPTLVDDLSAAAGSIQMPKESSFRSFDLWVKSHEPPLPAGKGKTDVDVPWKDALASLKELVKFSLQHNQFLAGPVGLLDHQTSFTYTLPEYVKYVL